MNESFGKSWYLICYVALIDVFFCLCEVRTEAVNGVMFKEPQRSFSESVRERDGRYASVRFVRPRSRASVHYTQRFQRSYRTGLWFSPTVKAAAHNGALSRGGADVCHTLICNNSRLKRMIRALRGLFPEQEGVVKPRCVRKRPSFCCSPASDAPSVWISQRLLLINSFCSLCVSAVLMIWSLEPFIQPFIYLMIIITLTIICTLKWGQNSEADWFTCSLTNRWVVQLTPVWSHQHYVIVRAVTVQIVIRVKTRADDVCKRVMTLIILLLI